MYFKWSTYYKVSIITIEGGCENIDFLSVSFKKIYI